MSAEEMTTKPAAEQTEHLGFAKRLGKRLSLGHGGKERSDQGGKTNEILNKSSSIRDEVSQGHFSEAKDIITKGQTTKESTTQGDAGGASSSAGLNKEGINKENVQEAGQQISKGGIGQDTTGKASTGASNVEQRATGNDKQETTTEGKKTEQKPKDTESEKRDRKSSVAAGILEPNYDVRKGPITTPGIFQEKNFHVKDGGDPTIMKREADSKDISAGGKAEGVHDVGIEGKTEQKGDSKVAFARTEAENKKKTTSNQGKTGSAISGGDYSDSFIKNELHDQENIGSDVFDEGTGGKDLSKKAAGQDASGKYHLDKAHLDKQGSQTSQDIGEGAAAAAAITGGYGASRGVTSKTSAPRNLKIKTSPSAGTSATGAQDLASTSPKSGVAAAPGGDERAGGQGLSSKYNTYAHAVSGQGSLPESAENAGNSTPRGLDEPGGLRSTATSQANKAFYSTSTTGSKQATLVGEGSQGLQPSSEYGATGTGIKGPSQAGLASAELQQGGASGALNTSKGSSNQAGTVGGGIQQGSASGTTSGGAFSNIPGTSGTANTSSKSTVVEGVTTKRTVRQLGSGGYKLTVLQERVQAVSQKCKTQLGLSSSEISKRSPSVDAFFDAVAAERLRWMPRDGSRLDCSLRWASRLAYAVDALRESVGAFAPAANEAATLIWGFSILLLEASENISISRC